MKISDYINGKQDDYVVKKFSYVDKSNAIGYIYKDYVMYGYQIKNENGEDNASLVLKVNDITCDLDAQLIFYYGSDIIDKWQTWEGEIMAFKGELFDLGCSADSVDKDVLDGLDWEDAEIEKPSYNEEH